MDGTSISVLHWPNSACIRHFINFSRSEIETAIIPIGNLVFCVGNFIFFFFSSESEIN